MAHGLPEVKGVDDLDGGDVLGIIGYWVDARLGDRMVQTEKAKVVAVDESCADEVQLVCWYWRFVSVARSSDDVVEDRIAEELEPLVG